MQSAIQSNQNPKTNIQTPRLRIVPFTQEHLTPRYVSWLNDPIVTRYSEQRHRAHTLDSCRDYWLSFHDTPHHFWAIVATDTHLGHIGNINAYGDTHNGVADVGIVIGERDAWGKGYGREAWTAVCRYLLHEQGLRKITAGTLSVNAPMRKIMERAGMVEEGRRVRQALWEGQEVDVIYAALFRNGNEAEDNRAEDEKEEEVKMQREKDRDES